MALRVGRIPFLHSEPFYFDMERRGITLVEMVPSALAAAAVAGDIDAGPLPLVDCFHLADRFEPVAGFCVASVKQSGSTFLYSTAPITDLDGARIGLTDEAATAARLLKVVLHLKYQVRPAVYGSLQDAPDAFLLIGNQGLCRRQGIPNLPYTYDLGAEWYSWTGLPFVFSRWMVRKDINPAERALLEDTLYVGLEEGVDALYHLSQPREDLLMLPRDIVRYIQGFRYYIGLSEQQAIERFRQYLTQLGT
jgi:chorismate dehydratase